MEFVRREAPYLESKADVATMMLQVLVALIPAACAHVWYFGPGLLFNLIVATVFCAGGEALMMRARGRAPETALSDYSVLVTAALLAFALPSLTPWWVTATGSLFAVVVAKHLYGGLGFNIFNPAMVGYVVILIAFPMELNLWVAPRMGDIDYVGLSILQTINYTLTGTLPDALTFDAVSRATPLDAMQSGLRGMRTYAEIRTNPMMGDFGGRGWEWIGNFFAIGGFWLLVKKIIRWQIPTGVFAGLLIPAGLMYIIAPGSNASPGFHLFSGATILCAFFIATDPVSAATSPRGRFVYGFGIGFLIFVIRKWGSYADGVAFAVILMNMATPAIDYLTRPHIVGHPRRGDRP
ncbi:MAG: RnfABCDGE type electron transport complex subunit D [Gammaproteobacteria bacterium]|nr:RnfABCDGE type electron transport complex subunit D [Gammaproteobacteria bacterium]MDH3372472.1 RnfABCDGE type electron transport complex subunit D [Gammaproteobacteria bacterium]MDH3407908.1 RnfABCDGE type electron transport complex subunit D [Gammaproteobacteria bacterium]MDH3551925.1 RnfABCDGE type electron transport complex subunit D [Gammaproteobacteria bacterium]